MANEFKVKKGLLVDGTGTVLDVQGTQGQLFSVTDSLTGDLFSVSDISGIPILNVNSSGVVSIEGAQVPTGTGTANKLTKWNSAGTGLEDTNISVVVSGATRQYTINGGQTGSGINLLTLNKDTGGASDRSMMFRIGTTQNDIVSDANYDTGELRFRLTLADGTETSILVLNSAGNVTMPGYSTGYLKTNSSGAITADNSTFLTSYSETDTLDTVCDRGASTNQTLTSTNALGLKVDSSADARIEIQGGGSNWSYVRLKDSITTVWDIASYNGGQLEWRPAGSATNRMTYTSGGILTTGDNFTSTKGNTAYGWGDHGSAGYLTSSSTQSKYIRSDASDTVNGDTTWEDGHYIALGNDGDFRIYHDGTNNHIRNYKHGANSSLQSESSMGSLHTCVGWGGANGYANLYYNGSQKLITVSGGVSVTGTVVASSNIGNLNSSSDIGQQLEYGDANVATLRCDANRWRVYMGGAGNSQETLTVTEEGRVGVKDSSPDYPLDVNGNVSSISIYASHDIAAYSDARVKGDIKTIPNALEKVNNLRGVTFVRTDEGSSDKRMMGVIAQEVKDIIPEVVTKKESDGHYAVSYGNMVGVLIEAVKELTAEVEELKKCGKCDNCNCKNK